MRCLFSMVVIAALGLLLCPPLLAQNTGVVEGLVVDSETGEPMIGVAVMLQGTSMGIASDLDGRFAIRNVPVGLYTLVASSIGYRGVTINNMAVDADKVTTLNFTMQSEALNLGEVVIEATAVNNTEAALLGIQKRAPLVADGVSAEQIRKSPDSDAGDAVKRVTGVTVVGDRYVYVRGMGERYNNTRLNGMTIASPEPLKRVVPFDIIPANLLDNIVVNKTATPDQPGDFAGGSVQLAAREFPEKLTIQASMNSGYNDRASLREFLTYRGGDRDFLGWDDGTRAIPDRVQDAENDDSWKTDTLLVKELAKEFPNVWEPRSISAPLNGSRSLSIGNQIDVAGKPLGYSVALTHSNSYSRREEEQFGYNYGGTGAQGLYQYQDLQVNRSTRSVNWGGILDLNTKLSANHKLSLKNLYTRGADDEVRLTTGSAKEAYIIRAYRLSWTERSLLSSQLRGTHELPAVLASRLEWAGSYSRGTYDQPDRRDVYYLWDEDQEVYQFYNTSESSYRRFAKMREDVFEGNVDWSLPLHFMPSPASRLKVGGLLHSQQRDFRTHKYYFFLHPDPDQPPFDFTLPAEVIFSPRVIDRYFELREISLALDSYDGDMEVQAGYVMADLLLGKSWRAVGGVRVEKTDQYFKTVAVPGALSSDFIEGGPKHTDVLPSLNVTCKLNERTNLRAAGSMTIANPDFAEIVPTKDNDYFEGATKLGNPNLKHTRIYNADLRAEYYPSPGENVAVGVFAKSLRDPIEWVLIPQGATETLQPQNFVDAVNLGAEFEFRKSLSSLAPLLGGWLQYMSAVGNLTVVSSRVELKRAKYDPASGAGGLLTSGDRPLMGQSEYVVNGILSFDHPVWGTGARLLYNTFGKRISQVGSYGVPDTYEEPFDKLDLMFSQRLGQHWSAKLQATNLLDSEVSFKTGDAPYNSYRVGSTYAAGLTYAF